MMLMAGATRGLASGVEVARVTSLAGSWPAPRRAIDGWRAGDGQQRFSSILDAVCCTSMQFLVPSRREVMVVL